VFRNLLGAAQGALIRAAASSQPFGDIRVEPLTRLCVRLSVTKILVHLLVACSVWLASSQNGYAAAQSRIHLVPIPKISSLSLCQLTKQINRHVGRTLRVRLTILGTGGHSPFFIAAEGCRPRMATIIWARFDSRRRSDSQLESRFMRAVGLHSEREGPKSESFLIGRVSVFENGSGYKMLILIRDLETNRSRPPKVVAEQPCS
jgi:hypothetical protein